MQLEALTAISPIDGRYWTKTKELSYYFSEFALIKYRVFVEIEYFIALALLPLPQLAGIDKGVFKELRKIYRNFSTNDAQLVKNIEKTTNHDVKAVEYFLQQKFKDLGLEKYASFIHFGLTSQDINNTAIPYALQKAMFEVYLPILETLLQKLYEIAAKWQDIPMLARTHGQPASPTRLGKEIEVYIERLQKQMALLRFIPISAKFGGATGNFNAHKVAYPNINWQEFANSFVNHVLDLERSQITTQIEHYDNLAALLDNFKRINTILIDFCQDIWLYISFDYFNQKINENEVGSSTMPHKVNPIDFENAEGNLGVANALYSHLTNKLPISRLQRDLTDSTVLRNLGVPMAHSILAFKSLLKGINKIVVNKTKILDDLNNNWSVIAEAIQTILRREGYTDAYEQLKKITRKNIKITKQILWNFIDGLPISQKLKKELKKITPETYTGY